MDYRLQLKTFVAAVAIVVFFVLYVVAMVQIALAPNGGAPAFSESYVAVVTALAGGLSSGFAIAIGVKAGTETIALRGTPIRLKDIFVAGLVTYAIVSALGVGVALFNPMETPQWFTSLALVFVGYLAALLAKAADPA